MKAINLLRLCVCVAFSLVALACNAENKVKYYEPALSELKGTIKMLTFPGRPNYEDIKNGDEPEKCPYLILDHTVDVVPKLSTPPDSRQPFDGERNICLVQLAVGNDADWKLMKDGMRVMVKGELFDALSGHHRTRVLLLVREAKHVKMASNTNHKKICIKSTCLSGLYDIAPSVKECSGPLCRCFSI